MSADTDGSGGAAGGPRASRLDAYPTAGVTDQMDENAQAALGADLVVLTLAQLGRHMQTAPLSMPMQNPTLLPLSSLEPGVLERVAAEIVSRQDNRGAQFYGRLGQFDPGSPDTAAPKSLGLVEDPVAVLRLDSLEADAMTYEATDALAAARLYGVVARELKDGNFPGHAAKMRRRQAKAARAGGDQGAAFSILFDLALDRVLAGEDFVFARSVRQELRQMMPALDAVHQAKLSVLTALGEWYERGSDLPTTVPGLRVLAAGGDPHAALLCCLVMEQALVDGLYDFVPARSTVVNVDADTAGLLVDLRDLAAASDSSNVVIRARLRCAVADAALSADANPCDVDVAYGTLIGDALAGRVQHACGLVTSRAAYAFAIRGDISRADNLWRQSVLASSEDGFYGDVRAAMRASQLLTADSGELKLPGLDVVTSALPNRRRLLAGAHDPALAALEAAHNDKLPDALGDTRRYLWEGRLAGHLQEELLALALFGDVLAAGGHPAAAVESYVAAGEARKAAQLAAVLPEPVNVRAWTSSAVRRRRAAANQCGEAPGTGTSQNAAENTTSPPGDAPTPVAQDATSNISDDAALTAAGPPNELAVAIAMHLTAMAEDERDGAASRAQAVSALRRLVNRLPPTVAEQLAHRLAAVHQAPQLSETDLWEISTDTRLSRTRFSTGARDLAALALVTSVKAFAASHVNGQVTDADRAFVDHAMASAARLLHDDRPRTRQLGALTVIAVATAAPEFSKHATSLLFHGDEQVRALGATHAPATPQMLAILARDPAPRVRAAVTGRTSELREGVRHALPQGPPSGRAPGHHEWR